MKKILSLLIILATTASFSALAVSEDLGFDLKLTGQANISYDNNSTSVNEREWRMESLWFKSELPREEITYSLTLKNGSFVSIFPNGELNHRIDLRIGEKVILTRSEAYTFDVRADKKYGLEVQILEVNSRPVLIQMPNPKKSHSTSFRAGLAKKRNN